MANDSWNISVPRFEGPLDLLLSLIRRNEYDIHNLPVAEITRQYLDYMHQAERIDLDLSADFAYTAATLIQIKSRSLLPSDPELAAREPDPKEELVRQLLDHEQVRNGAEFLKQRLEIAAASWSRGSGEWGQEDPERELADALPRSGSMSLFDVVRLAKKALDAARNHQTMDLGDAGPTVEEMIAFLERELPERGSTSGSELLRAQGSKDRQAVLFLALLELAKAEKVQLRQLQPFGQLNVDSGYGTSVPQR